MSLSQNVALLMVNNCVKFEEDSFNSIEVMDKVKVCGRRRHTRHQDYDNSATFFKSLANKVSKYKDSDIKVLPGNAHMHLHLHISGQKSQIRVCTNCHFLTVYNRQRSFESQYQHCRDWYKILDFFWERTHRPDWIAWCCMWQQSKQEFAYKEF